jgi:hypothetical protein
LKALSEAERVRPLAETDVVDDLSVYGLESLEDGMVVVRVTDVDGTTSVLHVGRTTPEGTATYVQRGPGAPVELAKAELGSLVRNSHNSFRMHDLFAVADSQIVTVTVEAGDVSYAAHRDDRGLWYLDDPDGRRLRRWKMRNLAYDLATSRIRSFVADHLSENDWRAYGLHQPFADVRFTSEDGISHRIRVGNEGGEELVFGRRDDETSVFLFPEQLLTTAEVPLEELLDTSPFAMNFDRLDSVRIVWKDGQSFGMARAGRDWKPVPTPDDEAEVESLRTPMRNVVYGLERTQALGTMLLTKGSTAAEVLDEQPLRCVMVWPYETVRFAVGWRSGEETHWIHVEGSRELIRVPRDLFFRLRGYLISAGRLRP